MISEQPSNMGSDKDIRDLSGGICDTPEVSPMLGGWIMKLSWVLNSTLIIYFVKLSFISDFTSLEL
jgi:hypothetical protein